MWPKNNKISIGLWSLLSFFFHFRNMSHLQITSLPAKTIQKQHTAAKNVRKRSWYTIIKWPGCTYFTCCLCCRSFIFSSLNDKSFKMKLFVIQTGNFFSEKRERLVRRGSRLQSQVFACTCQFSHRALHSRRYALIEKCRKMSWALIESIRNRIWNLLFASALVSCSFLHNVGVTVERYSCSLNLLRVVEEIITWNVPSNFNNLLN